MQRSVRPIRSRPWLASRAIGAVRMPEYLTCNLGRTYAVLDVSTYTIREAAVRSGFSPSALRYYKT